jgi:hypothetical protein
MLTTTYDETQTAATKAKAKPHFQDIVQDWLEEAVDTGNLVYKELMVNPALALEILDTCNTANRPVRWGDVRKWARKMSAHKWVDNGELLCITDVGRLANGQTRCLAVIESGETILMRFQVGVSDELRKTLDQGTARVATDHVETVTSKYQRKVYCTAARHLLTYDATNGFTVLAPFTDRPTPLDVAAAVEGTYAGALERAHEAAFPSVAITGVPVSLRMLAHCIIARKYPALADDFIEQLVNVGTNCPNNSVVRKLRAILVNPARFASEAGSDAKINAALSYILTAFNHWVAGSVVGDDFKAKFDYNGKHKRRRFFLPEIK